MTNIRTYLLASLLLLTPMLMLLCAHTAPISGDHAASQAPVTAFPARQGSPMAPDYDKVIITPRAFVAPYEKLADHHNDTGITTVVIATEDILSGKYFAVQGASDMEKYKYFIKDAIEHWNITYVLLGGDTGQIPPCEAYVFTMSGFFYTDLYYADVYLSNGAFADWDTNNDGLKGVFTDDLSSLNLDPDVNLGRLPSSNLSQAQWMVDKIIEYDDTAYGSDWSKNVTLLVGPTMDTGQTFSDYMCNNYYTAADGYNCNKLYDVNATKARFLNPANHSVGILSFWGHGGQTAWLGNGYINVTEVLQMQNPGKLPVVTMMACDCGDIGYSSDCMSESFLKKKTGGAVACLAGSQTSNGADMYDKSGAVCNYYHESYAINQAKTLGEMYSGMVGLYLQREAPLTNSLDYKNLVEYIHLADPATTMGGFSRTTAKLSVEDPVKEGNPGQVISFNVSVENTGDGYADLQVRLETPTGGQVSPAWAPQCLLGYRLMEGENKTFVLNVTCPTTANAGATLDIVLKVSSKNLDTPLMQTSLKATVNAVRSFEFSCAAPTITVAPGTNATFNLSVKNKGNGPETFLLNITDPPGWIHSFSQASVNLARNLTGYTLLTLRPQANLTAGICPHKVRCTIQGLPILYLEIGLNVTIQQAHGFLMDCTSDYFGLSQGATAQFNVSIENLGNHADSVTLALPAPSKMPGWVLESSRGNKVSLAPFASTCVLINATSPPLALAGDNVIALKGMLTSNGAASTVNLTAAVLPVFGFNLSSDVVEAIGTGQETLTFQLTLENIGNAGDTYDLDLAGLPADWNISMPSSVAVDPYSSKGATLEVIIGTDKPIGGSYLLDVTATSNKTSVSKGLELNITVEVENGVELLCTAANPLVAYLGTAQAQITLKNTGNVQDSFALAFEDDPFWTIVLDASSVPVDAYGEVGLSANLTAKKEAPPGLHTLTVEATSLRNAGLKDSADISLTLQQVYGLTLAATVDAAFLQGGDSFRINVNITNTGNGKDTFTLAPMMPDGWNAHHDEETTLDAGERASIEIIVAAPEDETAGTYPIKIVATSKGDTKVTRSVSLNVTVQGQEEPPVVDDDTGGPSVLMWVLIPILAVILVIIAVAVVIFLLMRRKKAGTATQPAQQAAAPVQQQAQGAPTQPGQQASPQQKPAGQWPGSVPVGHQAPPQQTPAGQGQNAGGPPAQQAPGTAQQATGQEMGQTASVHEAPEMQAPDTGEPVQGQATEPEMGAPDMMGGPDLAGPQDK